MVRRAGSRAVSLVLVVTLSCGISVQSSRAMLPELVVGGAVMIQMATVLGALVPQLATLGTSIVGVAKAGQQAQGTLQKLFVDIFGPAKKKDAPKPAAKDPTPISVPTITGPTDVAAAPAAPPAPAGDLDGKLAQLVDAYHANAQPAGDPAPAASAAPVSAPQPAASPTAVAASQPVADSKGAPDVAHASMIRADHSYETLTDQTAETLIETVRTGDRQAVERFVAAVKRLSPDDRPAVAPVLEQAIVRGAAFSRIYDEGPAVKDGFKKLNALRDGTR